MANHPIFAPTFHGEVARVRQLLDEDPALVKQRDAKNLTPLHVAASRGQDKVAQLLLERGADVTGPSSDNQWRPLVFAAYRGHLEVVKVLVGVMCLAFYIWMWDSSPLTSTVAADVVGYDQKSQGAVVRYQFEVDGKKVSAEQYANSTESKWRDANAKADVVYLNFMPSSNKLKKTVERMDWSILILGPIMPIVFLLGGHLGKRAMQRMARIEEKASHILRGEVTNRIRSKGTVIVQYKTKSPITNEEIFGGEQLGKLVPALKNMQIGSPVAIVYANDKEHTLL